jgi:hypothetical protein
VHAPPRPRPRRSSLRCRRLRCDRSDPHGRAPICRSDCSADRIAGEVDWSAGGGHIGKDPIEGGQDRLGEVGHRHPWGHRGPRRDVDRNRTTVTGQVDADDRRLRTECGQFGGGLLPQSCYGGAQRGQDDEHAGIGGGGSGCGKDGCGEVHGCHFLRSALKSGCRSQSKDGRSISCGPELSMVARMVRRMSSASPR